MRTHEKFAKCKLEWLAMLAARKKEGPRRREQHEEARGPVLGIEKQERDEFAKQFDIKWLRSKGEVGREERRRGQRIVSSKRRRWS